MVVVVVGVGHVGGVVCVVVGVVVVCLLRFVPCFCWSACMPQTGPLSLLVLGWVAVVVAAVVALFVVVSVAVAVAAGL